MINSNYFSKDFAKQLKIDYVGNALEKSVLPINRKNLKMLQFSRLKKKEVLTENIKVKNIWKSTHAYRIMRA